MGANLDSHLTMELQVNSVTRKTCFNIRRISKVKHLTPEACAKAINATVLVHLDYHNGLLLGVQDKTLRKLQVAQNSAAGLLTGTPRMAHITPMLKHLHWFPVRQRITFKVMTSIHRSSNQYGDRLFRVLGRRLWNELPADIRGPITQATFRKYLKTFLFRQAYNS